MRSTFQIALCALAATSPLEGAVRGAIAKERHVAPLPALARSGRDIAALDRLARKNRRKRR